MEESKLVNKVGILSLAFMGDAALFAKRLKNLREFKGRLSNDMNGLKKPGKIS